MGRSRLTEDGVAVLAALPLTEFVLMDFTPTPAIVDALLPAAPTLRQLGGLVCDDAALGRLTAFSALNHLGLRCGTGLTGRGLAELALLPSLISLTLVGATETELSAALALPGLRALTVKAGELTDADFAALPPGMLQLDIHGPDLTDAVLDRIVPLAGLHVLTLACPALTPAGVARLAQLPELGHLTLSHGTPELRAAAAALPQPWLDVGFDEYGGRWNFAP